MSAPSAQHVARLAAALLPSFSNWFRLDRSIDSRRTIPPHSAAIMRSTNPLEILGPLTPAPDSGDCSFCAVCCGERGLLGEHLLVSRRRLISRDSCSAAASRVSRFDDGSRAQPPPVRSWRRSLSLPTDLLPLVSNMKSVALLGLFAQASLAAFVRYENCLQDSYRNYDPRPLQWLPNRVDAIFDTTDPKHTLRVTMWGNVTGAFTNVTLPPPGSPDWNDPTKLDGKILDEPEKDSPSPKLTTLHSKVEVLTYQPWSNNTNFCQSVASAGNSSCPLAPVFSVNKR